MMARKQRARDQSSWTSRSGTCCRVSGGDSSTTFNGARLRGFINPQAPVGCSGDVKQQRAQTIAITDHSERQSTLSHCCWVLLASEYVFRSAMNAMLCSMTSILRKGVWPDHGT